MKSNAYIKHILLSCWSLFLCTTLSAQRIVTGTVTEAATGETLIGANVVVKGTTIGTATDMDGFYTLNVPSSGDTVGSPGTELEFAL